MRKFGMISFSNYSFESEFSREDSEDVGVAGWNDAKCCGQFSQLRFFCFWCPSFSFLVPFLKKRGKKKAVFLSFPILTDWEIRKKVLWWRFFVSTQTFTENLRFHQSCWPLSFKIWDGVPQVLFSKFLFFFNE